MLGYRERVGLLLLQLFPNDGATDIVFVTLFCIAVGTAITFVTLFRIAVGTAMAWCCGRCAMPDGHSFNILLFWRRSTVGLNNWSSGLTPVSRFHSSAPLSHSSPSLIGLLASVDAEQQKSSTQENYDICRCVPPVLLCIPTMCENKNKNKTKTHQGK